jgi:hypothetical protein
MNQLVGTYQGDIFAISQLQPSLTSFYFTSDGRLVGKYFINYTEFDKEYKINWFEGELIDFKPRGEYMASMIWSDEAGKGNLRLLFTFDAKKFVGYWGFNQSQASSFWNGIKISDKPTLTRQDIAAVIGTMNKGGAEADSPSPAMSGQQQNNQGTIKNGVTADVDSFQRILKSIGDKLSDNNIGEAMSYFDENARKELRDIFEGLRPAQRAEFAQFYLDARIIIDKIDNGIALCHYITTYKSRQMKVYVNFKTDASGQWKVFYIGKQSRL